MKKEKKQTGKSKWKWVLLVLFIIAVISAGGGYLYYSYLHRVYTQCITEAGTEVVLEDFLKSSKVKAEFLEGFEEIDTTKPGIYPLKIKSWIFTYDCSLTIEDTTMPEGETKRIYSEIGKEIQPEEFFSKIEDVTPVTVSYEQEPDYQKYGEQQIKLLLTDSSGNTAEYEEMLVIRSIRYEVTMEAGDELPDIRAFLLEEGIEAEFVTDMNTIDKNAVKDWQIQVRSSGMDYDCVLHVVDTTPPQFSVKNLEQYAVEELELEDFVVHYADLHQVTVSYAQEPDKNLIGTQDVVLRATDEYGNVTEQTAKLTLHADTEAPVLTGVADITIYERQKISYRNGISVTDNCDKNISFWIENSSVNTSQPGEYPVKYIAQDRSGNRTVCEAKVTVLERVYTEGEIYALADQILAKIITDTMTPLEKVHAIYNWVHTKIGYINYTDKSDWKKAAYEGMVLHKGDCFAYASTSKALLTRAGITNMDIHKIPTDTRHYWNLVDIGEGWYHFDTTPRHNLKQSMCYLTDAELMVISAAHENCHNYDRSQYPQIQ